MVGLPAIRQAGLGQGFSGFTYFSLRFIRRVCGGLASRQYGGLFSVNFHHPITMVRSYGVGRDTPTGLSIRSAKGFVL
jgi:hypothetical protein